MGRVAKAYSDDDFNAMGEFFSQKMFVRYPQKVDAAKVAKGKELHEQNCKKCHMENGRESEDGGVIAGQWSEYLHITMDDFASKKRAMPKKMAEKIEGLSKDDARCLDSLLRQPAITQEEKNMSNMNRRSFIKLLGAATGVGLAGAPFITSAAEMLPKKGRRVVVIGGGYGGIDCCQVYSHE